VEWLIFGDEFERILQIEVKERRVIVDTMLACCVLPLRSNLRKPLEHLRFKQIEILDEVDVAAEYDEVGDSRIDERLLLLLNSIVQSNNLKTKQEKTTTDVATKLRGSVEELIYSSRILRIIEKRSSMYKEKVNQLTHLLGRMENYKKDAQHWRRTLQEQQTVFAKLPISLEYFRKFILIDQWIPKFETMMLQLSKLWIAYSNFKHVLCEFANETIEEKSLNITMQLMEQVYCYLHLTSNFVVTFLQNEIPEDMLGLIQQVELESNINQLIVLQ